MNSRILGTWNLINWSNRLDDGTEIHPFGEDPTGYIHYAEDGHVFVHIMMGHRENYVGSDPFKGTLDEDATAIKSQISYAGTYKFIDGKIVHHVTISSFPNWVGGDQFRDYDFIDGQLYLNATGAQFQGQNVTATLVWKR